MPTESATLDAQQLARCVQEFIDEVAARSGSTKAIKPGHRVKFAWPPHPISYSYHVMASDWTGSASFTRKGEEFEVKIARTPHGVFGRCEPIWLEARGETQEEMLASLQRDAEPFFVRQEVIAATLGIAGRYLKPVRELSPLSLVKLLYCSDRDVANDAQTEIETHARSGLFTQALITVLCDHKHPRRRSAQWCVLDMFEDLPSFCTHVEDEEQAVTAMKDLLWTAEDDYARTAFKAGVVLGGHIPYRFGGPVLLECLDAPSKIGRRSAIHGLFHVVEWIPSMREKVVAALREQAVKDPEPLLQRYAAGMADDIEADEPEHVQEPVFPDED